MKNHLSSSHKLALIFLVFGICYVLFSDYLTLWISKNNISQYNRIQHYKGIVFIFFSAGLIYIVSKKLNASIDKANREQEEALRRYNVLGMATNDAVWDLNMKTGECFTNRTLQEIFGYTADELMDNNTWWTNNLHPEDKQRVISTIEAKLKGGGTVWQDEYRFRCKDGSYKIVFDRGFIMRDKNGNPYRLIGAMQDVSEQRALQQELIEEKVRHKNQMALSVINAQEIERKKLGEELHDNINQLLGVVKLYIEHAQVDQTAKNEMLKKSSEYLMQVIQEIRNLSKSLIPPTLNDIGLLESLYELISTLEDTKHIRVHLDTSDFDEQKVPEQKKLMIYRIIQEQLNNVIKHSHADDVSIRLKNLNNTVQLMVEDNGKGFDAQNNKPGTGLNNIRNRLEVFNGNMQIRSNPGEGCVLEVEFDI
jgi:two-component system, NarL family, sensor histidine kinase UhpB